MNDINNPFKIRGLASDEHFYNRTQELGKLARFAQDRTHTLLVAPRRMGKTSLLRTLEKKLSRTMQVVVIDLFKCASLSEFVSLFASELIKAQRSPVDKLLGAIRKGIPSIIPKISFSVAGEPQISIDLEPVPANLQILDEVLHWFDKLQNKKPKLIILDEFQEIASFEDSGKIEKSLRASLQDLQHTSLIYSGSLPSILREMFVDKKRAFYQSATILELGSTPHPEATDYLLKKLESIDPVFDGVFCESLAKSTQGHPYYTQLAGYLCFEIFLERGSGKEITPELVIQEIFKEERTSFENSISNLTAVQRKVYRAICREPGAAITSSDFLRRHHLPAHSSVLKAAKKLEAEAFIRKAEDRGYYPTDPLLGMWWQD